MLKLTNQTGDINFLQLNRELASLALPGFQGSARLSRDSMGQRVAPYILIKCGDLTPLQQAAVRDVIAAHVPQRPVARDWAGELDKATTLTEVKTWLRGYLHP